MRLPPILRALGHPAHTILTHFPMAFLGSALVLDGLGLVLGESFWRRLAFWNLVLGVASALPTVATGLFDARTLNPRFPAGRAARRHLWLMLTMLLAFGGALFARGGEELPAGEPRLWLSLALEALGALLMTAGGWFGGELVFGYRIGIKHGAEKPAPAAAPPGPAVSPPPSTP